MTRSSRRTSSGHPHRLLIAIASGIALLLMLVLAPEPAAAKVLVGQQATLTQHANGMPSSADPGRRLQRAEVSVDVYDWGSAEVDAYVKARVTLQGTPATDWENDAALMLGLGVQKGSNCEITHTEIRYTSGDGGREYELIERFSDIGAKWTCVVVALDNGIHVAPTVTHDALVGRLTDRFESPKPKITGVELLRKKQKRLKLVRGSWTTLEVDVKNAGAVDAKSFRVKGAGKRLKVRRSPAEELPADWTRGVDLKVKPVGKVKRSKLRIVAIADGVRTSRALRVRVVKPPKRPASGQYKSDDGHVSFSIRKGRVVGWRGYMTTTCGGYPDFPTMTRNHYDFPRVKVPRNGIVNASDKHELYSVHLQMRAVGKRVTSGWFFYSGPARCTASKGFTAKRVGR